MGCARVLVIATACLALRPVFAFDGEGRYAAQGAVSCVAHLDSANRSLDGSSSARNEGWVEGYLGAFNWLVPDTFQILGDSEVSDAVAWVDAYCRDNPSGDTADAMEALILELYPRRRRAGEPRL